MELFYLYHFYINEFWLIFDKKQFNLFYYKFYSSIVLFLIISTKLLLINIILLFLLIFSLPRLSEILLLKLILYEFIKFLHFTYSYNKHIITFFKCFIRSWP
uniref:Uncharacterized protein n=1 Tax=Orbilia brochopaga TaxID=3140254 RepID=A0A481ZN21_9PEZI|nr:hypothetical protein [Drechslerella brochopaga]QBL02506.1 hypothetical protein [Drechslerella brochopaga]